MLQGKDMHLHAFGFLVALIMNINHVSNNEKTIARLKYADMYCFFIWVKIALFYVNLFSLY